MFKKCFLGPCLLSCLFLISCGHHMQEEIVFGIAPEYPPFEFYQDDKIVGFDIDLAHMIAKHLNREAVIHPYRFDAILPSIDSGHIDAGLSTITITPERQAQFSFSIPYYKSTLSALYHVSTTFSGISSMENKNISYQKGTTMEQWTQKYIKSPAQIIWTDNMNDTINEIIKKKKIDFAILDTVQAREVSKKNPKLTYSIIAITDQGYGIAMKKDNPLIDQINKAISALQKDGSITKLEKKWL